MNFGIGSLLVIGCVLGGYAAMGGHLGVLWQPFELVIIGGAAVGAFMISNPMPLIKATAGGIGGVFKGPPYSKESYLELLTLLFTIFKLAKTKGMLALESHVEKPEESSLFSQFPKFASNHHALVFLCDYLRLLTLGSDNPHEMESLMDEEIETHHKEGHEVAGAIQTMADGLPALGIVAAVLGVIKTMGAISQPPAILGKYIGGALVGTFLGVLLAYGFVAPMANYLSKQLDSETKYYLCIKAGILAYMQGNAPAVCVEFARKTLFSHERPTFYEVEQACANMPAV